MLRVWGRNTSANIHKLLWCCSELGLEYERVDVGGPFGGLDDPKYLKLNPNGLIPTIEDDGFVLWESNTIVRYLAAKHSPGGLYPLEPRKRADAEKWMDWHLSHLVHAVAGVFFGLYRTPPEKRNPDAIEASRRQSIALWAMVDAQLADRDYVGGNALTIGDIPMGSWAFRWFTMDIERPPHPNLQAWFDRLCKRPGYREHVMQPF
ncbi:MAG: glutathione S-transferase [Rhodospirillaceae bacterium]|jgi:glutathione S-transferase|nr:glutathione S-transferase [Rhodospirillaceae bacterium]